MNPRELIDHYRTKYRFHKETGMAANSLGNWLEWGYVPELAQYKIERITKGRFTADFSEITGKVKEIINKPLAKKIDGEHSL